MISQTVKRAVKRLMKKPLGLVAEMVAQRVAENWRVQHQDLATLVSRQVAEQMATRQQRLSEEIGHILKLEKLVNQGPVQSAHELLHECSDEFWYWLHTEGLRRSPELRSILPGLPDEETQIGVCALRGDDCLQQAFSVYQLFKRLYEKHRGRLAEAAGVLDFGCGWGRIMRFFLRDLAPAKLCGIDINARFIEAGQRTNPWCQFDVANALPPTRFGAETFDLVYCFSVFSHLPEDVHLQWLAEFERILRPGGLLIATTWGRDYIPWVASLRDNGVPAHDAPMTEFFKVLLTLFPDQERALAAYDRGNYCYADHGYGYSGMNSYGDACISQGYVAAHWSKHFHFLEFIDDRQQCMQNVIVVRK